jgi:hypothetical protein
MGVRTSSVTKLHVKLVDDQDYECNDPFRNKRHVELVDDQYLAC